MLSPCVICNENDSVLEVSKILRDTNSRHLFVCKNKKPIGIISTTDIVNRCIASDHEVKDCKASDIMTKEVKSIDVKNSLEEIEDLIEGSDPHSLPVTHEGKLIGIVELWQIVKLIMEKERK